jgi:hypothetical protein
MAFEAEAILPRSQNQIKNSEAEAILPRSQNHQNVASPGFINPNRA